MDVGLSKSVPVKFSEVLDAFEFVSFGGFGEHHAYIASDTGKVYFVSDTIDVDEDNPDDLDTSDRYIALPHKNELDLGTRLVFLFADREMPHDYDHVRDIFRRRGAYSHFKQLLMDRGMLDKWHAFEASSTEKTLRIWCRNKGILLRNDGAPMKKGYKQLLAEAEAEIETLEVEDAIALHGQPGVVFVDLRDPREMEREGKMPGAFACTRGMLEFWIDPESPYAKPIFTEPKRFVFFCAGGWRSALAAKTAQDMGLENVAHVEGGFGAWKTAGGPVAAPKTV